MTFSVYKTLILVGVSCFSAVAHSAAFEERIHELKTGMSDTEVAALLGDPFSRTQGTSSDTQRWDYCNTAGSKHKCLTLRFKKNILRFVSGDYENTRLSRIDTSSVMVPVINIEALVDPRYRSDSPTEASEDELIFSPLFPEQDVRNALEHWRQAWMQRNVQAFIQSYRPGYTSHKWMSHEEWVKRRYEGFAKHQSINVAIDNLNIEAIDNRHYAAVFTQSYQSSRFKDKTVKRLVFEFRNENWLIKSERTLKKL